MSQFKQESSQHINSSRPLTDIQSTAVLNKMQQSMPMPEFDLGGLLVTPGKFGLKTEADVRAFLKTPKAQAEIGKYAKELAITKTLLEESLFEMILRQLLKLFLKAAKKAAKKDSEYYKEINAAYQREIDQQKAKREKKKEELLTQGKNPDQYLEELAEFDKKILDLETKIAENNRQIENLEEKIEDIDQQLFNITQRYAIYETAMEGTIAHLSQPEARTAQNLDQILNSFDAAMNRKSEKVAQMQANPDADQEKLLRNIYKREALGYQKSMVEQDLDVLNGTKTYYDIFLNPVQLLMHAAYIASHQQTIAKDAQGRPMLIDSTMIPNNMSQEQQQLAHEHFLEREYHLQTLPRQVQTQKQEAVRPLETNKMALIQNLTQTRQGNIDLNAKLNLAQAQRKALTISLIQDIPRLAENMDSTEKMVLRLGESGITPAPTPTLRPEPKNSAKDLEEELAELRKHGASVTPERLLQLVALLPESKRPAALLMLDTALNMQQKNKPVAPGDLPFILRNIELLGVNTPNLQAMKENVARPSTAPTPSPFKTTGG